MEDFLSCGASVLLDDGDSVGFGCVFHGDCHAFDEFVDVADQVFWHVVDCFVVCFRDD